MSQDLEPKPNALFQRPNQFRQTRHFREACKKVTELYTQGAGLPEIAAKTGLRQSFVRKIVSQGSLKSQVAESMEALEDEIRENALPVAKEINITAHELILGWLQHQQSTGNFKKWTPLQAKVVHSIAKEAFEIARLEDGKSTQNIEVTNKSTKTVENILVELAEIDPFKTYPTLETKSEPESGTS